MKETVEFRINYDYAYLLFGIDEGKDLGQFNKSVKIITLSKDDPRYNQIPIVSKKVRDTYDKGFLYSWQIKRKYTKKELENATILQVKIKTAFEPTGEECGTLYDERVACEICGANRKQISQLMLKKGSIPKKDIARTIGGQIVVSEKFVKVFKQRNFKGAIIRPITFSNQVVSGYYQLSASDKFELSKNTIAGDDPFESSEGSNEGTYDISGYEIKYEKEVYKCPKGHIIGLNILSEAYVLNNAEIYKTDFFCSNQKIGVRRGLLQPEPIYFCSQDFKKMVEEEKLIGFDFEVAKIG